MRRVTPCSAATSSMTSSTARNRIPVQTHNTAVDDDFFFLEDDSWPLKANIGSYSVDATQHDASQHHPQPLVRCPPSPPCTGRAEGGRLCSVPQRWTISTLPNHPATIRVERLPVSSPQVVCADPPLLLPPPLPLPRLRRRRRRHLISIASDVPVPPQATVLVMWMASIPVSNAARH